MAELDTSCSKCGTPRKIGAECVPCRRKRQNKYAQTEKGTKARAQAQKDFKERKREAWAKNPERIGRKAKPIIKKQGDLLRMYRSFVRRFRKACRHPGRNHGIEIKGAEALALDYEAKRLLSIELLPSEDKELI